MNEFSLLIYDADLVKSGLHDGIGLHLKKIIQEEKAPPIFRNSCLLGGFCKASGIDWDLLERVLRRHIPKNIELNMRVARRGYEEVDEKVKIEIHDNRIYGLTTGQHTPTSPAGFRSRSTPFGLAIPPLNPLERALASGATFVARGYSSNIELLKDIFKKAILHRGFSFVEVLQVCATFFNIYQYYNEHVYELEDHNPTICEIALSKIREWDYNRDPPIPLGIFYRVEAPTFEENFAKQLEIADREEKIREILKRY